MASNSKDLGRELVRAARVVVQARNLEDDDALFDGLDELAAALACVDGAPHPENDPMIDASRFDRSWWAGQMAHA